MITKTKKKNLIITLGAALILYFLYKVRGILWPFVLGGLIAYLFRGLATKLSEKLNNRSLASLMIVSLFTIIIVLFFVFIIPILVTQTVELVKELTTYLATNSEKISEKMLQILNYFDIENGVDFKKYITNYNKNITVFFMGVLNNLLSTSIAFASLVSIIIITPVTAYYFIKEWDNLISNIKSYIPKKNKEKVINLFKKIDNVLTACIREQLIVCCILSLFYGTFLALSGLKFGFLIGLITGLASFIPYVGMFIGFFIALMTNFYQFGFDLIHLSILMAIFLIGQILEGNFLTPTLVGSKINLHPLWVIFALFAGGSLFGLTGMLIALPISAVLGVLIRFYLKENIKKYD